MKIRMGRGEIDNIETMLRQDSMDSTTRIEGEIEKRNRVERDWRTQ
jgi:hypothetical protein